MKCHVKWSPGEHAGNSHMELLRRQEESSVRLEAAKRENRAQNRSMSKRKLAADMAVTVRTRRGRGGKISGVSFLLLLSFRDPSTTILGSKDVVVMRQQRTPPYIWATIKKIVVWLVLTLQNWPYYSHSLEISEDAPMRYGAGHASNIKLASEQFGAIQQPSPPAITTPRTLSSADIMCSNACCMQCRHNWGRHWNYLFFTVAKR